MLEQAVARQVEPGPGSWLEGVGSAEVKVWAAWIPFEVDAENLQWPEHGIAVSSVVWN